MRLHKLQIQVAASVLTRVVYDGRPQPLQLTAADELLAIENIDVLRRNGFEVDVDGDWDGVPGQGRLKLISQPVSKRTDFDMKGDIWMISVRSRSSR